MLAFIKINILTLNADIKKPPPNGRDNVEWISLE